MSEEDFELSDSEDMKEPYSEPEVIYDSDVEIIDMYDIDPNWRLLCIADVEADPVCKRLDKLIRDGHIRKDQIFYKYLDDMTSIFYDSKHPYDKDVIEFFTSILHHGGESTYNIVRGPMRQGNEKTKSNEVRMNFGGPGIETIRKQKAAYTTSPGVFEHLTLLLYRLIKSNDQAVNKSIVNNDVVEVLPVAFSNDGTAIKPCIQFDERRNVNVGLEMMDINYQECQSKSFLDKDTITENIICEVVVSSLTSLDNDSSLPVAVNYASKSGKSGDNIKKSFTEQIRILQTCENCVIKTKELDLILGKDVIDICESYC
ncbi:uncharacterized protein [Clytia hemisphaerica]|uniref:uncharacterized protein n=1 Tax=Clytia hemisphaerica TaxID=252671 RepID=UPI0034D645C7